jgi:Na+/melibiose symporter-like transporter
MWSAEGVANTFVGPPLGSLMIGIGFALPFVFDAASFFAAAALVSLIPGTFRASRAPAVVPDVATAAVPDVVPAETVTTTSWRVELKEGVTWLWAHPVLRPMAIVLGLMNLASMVSGATFVLFAQEVLDVGPFVFAIIGMGGAIGGVVGGVAASRLAKRFGPGTCLSIVTAGFAVSGLVMALNSWWPLAFVLFTIESLFAILWNVITVSFRQSIIPEHLLGRVNSVYRFFAWGMMPIGAAVGGALVAVVDSFTTRDNALRSTWLLNAAIHAALWATVRGTLSTARIDAARTAGALDNA